MMTIKKNRFERARIDLLAAILRKDREAFVLGYERLVNEACNLDELDESSQKNLSQIFHMVKRFHEKFSLMEEADLKAIHARLRKKLAWIARVEIGNAGHVSFSAWQANAGLSGKPLAVFLSTVTTFQLTKGCSNFCRRCNEWALPGQRKHFSFDAVKTIVAMIFKTGNRETIYYGASDPLDWEWEDRTILDIVYYMVEKGFRPEYGMLTKIPRGKENLLLDLIGMEADVGVSMTNRNRQRVTNVKDRAGDALKIYHDHETLLIPAGLDEDFVSAKPSITDNYGSEITPDGAFIIIPTFTSALNPTGQHRIPVSRHTAFFIERKTGRAAMTVEYYKPLDAVDGCGRPIKLKTLLYPQIENILLDHGRYDLTPPGMTSFPEYLGTYDASAVEKRRKLIPSAIKGFMEKYLADGSLKKALPDEKRLFKEHVAKYLEFCHMETVNHMKQYVFSYYLSAISRYLKEYAPERDIIRYIRRNEAPHHEVIMPRLVRQFNVNIDRMINDSGLKTSDLFQGLVFRLLKDPDDEVILKFIESCPAIYDDVFDRFVRATTVV